MAHLSVASENPRIASSLQRRFVWARTCTRQARPRCALITSCSRLRLSDLIGRDASLVAIPTDHHSADGPAET